MSRSHLNTKQYKSSNKNTVLPSIRIHMFRNHNFILNSTFNYWFVFEGVHVGSTSLNYSNV